MQEVIWRGYFKGWLQRRPQVWCSYRAGLEGNRSALDRDRRIRRDVDRAMNGQTGLECALHCNPIQAFKPRAGRIAQPVLVPCDIGHPEPHHIIQSHAQTDGLHDSRGASFEFHRRIVVDNADARKLADHVAATHKGPHAGHPVLADINRA